MSSSTSLTSNPISRTSSIASNSSGASLTRRPGIRARSRSRTVAGNSQKSSRTCPSELPYLETPYVQEPPSYTPQEQHLRPPEPDVFDTRDLRGRASGSLQGSSESGGLDVTIVADSQSPLIPKVPKANERASSLPHIVTTYNPPPSSFLCDTPLTPNVRDSVSTQKSNASSSVYPLSMFTTSGPASPTSPTSFRPMSEDIEHFEISSLDPEVEDGIPGFDPDDVAYRLRLLVKNNYFLPPAHSKPILSVMSPPESRKPSRAATPTFMDIFNKLKLKPASPTGSGREPILRATGDAMSAPHSAQPRTSMQSPRSLGSPNGLAPERTGRVVVVREKMEDLVVAAKQAEQEIKSRGIRRDVDPLTVQVLNDVDPTDDVDIPPPSPSYPFAMQTSAMRGLGVEDSISAAVLAERLPPGSPGLSSIDPAEDDWRRSLLQAAVHHSLENTADLSSFSNIAEISTPFGSPGGKESQSQRNPVTPTPKPRHLIGQRILEQPFSDSSESFRDQGKKETSKSASTKSLSTTEYLSAESISSSRPSSYVPIRVATPTDPWTALTPPPPRKQCVPFVSQSQTDLPASTDPTERPCRTPTPTLRKTASSPMLSSANRITPPPLPTPNLFLQGSSHDQVGSNNTSQETERSNSAVTDSMYSEDEYVHRAERASAALSALMSRPSLSEYSQDSLSPTTSAFQEDLNTHVYSPLAMSFQTSVHEGSNNRDSPVPRDSTMSPPPRISSSLAHVALPPPPRGSSLRHPPLPIGMVSYPRPDTKSSLDSMMEIVIPEPTTPPIPLSERRGNPSGTPLALHVPAGKNTEAAIPSAPAPSSPTSFFDSVQSLPNALDDLDSSDDDSDDVHNTSYADTRSRTMSNLATPSKPPLMRLGNHSSPHISRTTRSTEERRIPLPFGVQDAKQPIANVPQRKPFFVQHLSGKNSDHGHGAPVSSFDFYQYSKQHDSPIPEPKPKRPATAGEAGFKATKAGMGDESLRSLDVLLQQHMVAEKDTIRRIAQTLQSQKSRLQELSKS